MPRSRLCPMVRREDYDAFKRLAPGDLDWPDAFDEWFQRVSVVNAKLIAGGNTIDEVVVDPDEFAGYCRASGLDANHSMLNAFAVAKKHRK